MAEDSPEKGKIARSGFLFSLILSVLLCLLSGVALVHAEEPVPAPQKKTTARKFTRKSKEEAEEPRTGTRLLVSGKSMHLSCTRSLRDLEKNKLECFGNVYIRRPSELLTADYAIMDLNTDELHAEGNVVYFTPDTVIYGTKMDFNFNTETGIIDDGRIESDKYQLLGEKIERLAIDHFKAYDGEYTTCRDCPASWKIAGKTIDLTVDGYAHLSQVFIKINEAPALYLPYAIIPVKTRRQSGLLFPRIQPASQNGFTFMQPFFWAISRSTDATIAAGFFAQRGIKGEGQFRYVLSPRSHGEFNGFYLRDKQFIRDPYYNRWALNYQHNIELPFHIDQKLNYIDASDRDYARNIGDIPGRGEPALVSEAGLSRSGRDVSVWLSGKRIHNMITPGLTGFDGNTVQLAPSVSVATADHRIADDFPLHWGIGMNFSRFWRPGPSFDPIYPVDFRPPSDNFFLSSESFTTPLRRAERFSLVPELYYTAKVGNILEIVPSVQYRTYYYLFDQGVAPPLARGYLLAQTEVGTTIERVYGDNIKHKFRPSLTYSNIPLVQQNLSHPFIRQIKTAGNEFDESDIVPISNDTQLYFVPLGNSLAYRFSNKLIVKTSSNETGNTYRQVVDLTSGQSFNFIEYRNSLSGLRAQSRFFSLLTVDTKRVTARGEYYYYPSIRQPTYNLTATYVFARYTRRLLIFERSVGLNYSFNQVTTNSDTIGGNFNWSFNDYFAVTGGIDYRFPTIQSNALSPGVVVDINAGVTYQSPSQCYRVTLLASRAVDNPKVAVTFNIPVNLSGEGFMNLQEGGGLVPGQGQH